MTINGVGSDECVTVTTIQERAARLVVEAEGQIISISIDANHLQALEMALRAARLEIEARAVPA